jgi:uncharacterized protein (DUF58 family)
MLKVTTSVARIVDRWSGPVTPLGRSTIVVGLVSWMVAALFDWEELAIVAAACAVAVLIAVVFTLGRTQLAVELDLNPRRVVVGQTAVADLTIRNTGGHRMLPVRLEIPVGPAVANVSVPSLGSGETFEEMLVIPTVQRCVLPIGPTRSVRGDPLALMRREVEWLGVEELFVHPLTTQLTGVTSGWLRDLEGRPTNDRSPSDVAFHTLREYVPGDDRRHVHWRTSARIGKMMVRQFIDNRRSHLGIVIDTNPTSYSDAEEFELAVSMAASLGLRVITEGQEVSCVAGSVGVASHTGQALLDGLARVELGVPAIDISETAFRAAPMLQAASIIGIVTGSGLAPNELQAASRRFGLDTQILIIRSDPSVKPGVARTAGAVTITAGTLTAFTQAMWVVSGS